MATNSLSELMSKPFVGELTEGKHSAILLNWTLVANPDPEKEYIRMIFSVDNGNTAHQEYTRNLFLRDVSIALSHMRRQLGKANETIDPKTFLDSLKAERTPLDLWISYPIVSTRTGAKRVQNIYFQPPITANDGIAAGDMETPELS